MLTSSSAVDPRPDPSWSVAERVIASHVVGRLGATLYADMREMESVVRDSGLEWTVMRPLGLATTEPPDDYAVAVNHISGHQTSRHALASAILDEITGTFADGRPAPPHVGECVAVASLNASHGLAATIWREGIRPMVARSSAARR